MRTRINAIAGVIFLLLTIALPLFIVDSAKAYNDYQFYRWPWQYNQVWNFTQGWNGATSHFSGTGLYYAIDVQQTPAYSRPIFSAQEGTATCNNDTVSGFGYYSRVTYGSNSSMYAHMSVCSYPAAYANQGYQIGSTGNSGSGARSRGPSIYTSRDGSRGACRQLLLDEGQVVAFGVFDPGERCRGRTNVEWLSKDLPTKFDGLVHRGPQVTNLDGERDARPLAREH